MKYDFDEIVDRSGTLSTKWEACPGRIPLWVADMDLPCAQPILDALHARVDRRIFGYTETLTQEYTDAVRGWTQRRFGYAPQPEWIRYAGGVIQIISCLVYLLSKPGDRIIIQRPVYGPFAMSTETQGRVVSDSKLKLTKQADGFARYEIDFDDLAVRFADPGTVGMILCSPHNPVGRVWTAQELRRIVDLAKANGKWIIADEIHSDIVRADQKQHALLAVAPDYAENIYVCTSPSKTFNLAGMQLANAFIANAEVRRRWDGYVANTLHVGHASPLSIAAMIAAYTEGEDWLDQANAYMDANIAWLEGFVREQLPKAVMTHSEGTYLCWLNLTAYEPDAKELNRRLRDDAKVWLTEGTAFGAEDGLDWQRVNVACPRSQLAEGMRRIAAELTK